MNNMKTKRVVIFILINLVLTFIFGVLYYLVQFVEDNAFYEIGEGMKLGEKEIKKYSLLRCLHFGLSLQTTIGYSGFVPFGPISSVLNAIHLICIFTTTAVVFL